MAFIKITDRVNHTEIILNDSCIAYIESDQRDHSNIYTTAGGKITAFESVKKIYELINPAGLPEETK